MLCTDPYTKKRTDLASVSLGLDGVQGLWPLRAHQNGPRVPGSDSSAPPAGSVTEAQPRSATVLSFPF